MHIIVGVSMSLNAMDVQVRAERLVRCGWCGAARLVRRGWCGLNHVEYDV